MSLLDTEISGIKIVEVGPRDGLQNEPKILSTDSKIEFIKKLQRAGLKTIEATSFVKPSAIAQMSDAKILFSHLKKFENFHEFNFPCLVPNMKGYESARSVGVQEIALFSATSNTFNKRNINATIDESFIRLSEVSQQAKIDGIKMRGYISTAFGCPYEGVMTVKNLASVLERFFKLGVYEVSIGDTIGVATPKQVQEFLNTLKDHFAIEKLALHFHDTRAMALVNILSSLEFGVRIFDASAGGLGGCPYARGASGNVATEEVIYLLDSLGVPTGVNLELLCSASEYILEQLGQKRSNSKFLNAYLNQKN